MVVNLYVFINNFKDKVCRQRKFLRFSINQRPTCVCVCVMRVHAHEIELIILVIIADHSTFKALQSDRCL